MHDSFDVAIVGLGPAGASLANLLGQAGLSVVVFEREAAIYPLPRAIHFDGEVMRVFHGIGLRREIEAVTRPGFTNMHFVNAQNHLLPVRDASPVIGDWLVRPGAQAVLLRPDRYIVRTARDAAELARLTETLPTTA